MAAMQIDPARRAVSLDPRDPAFYNNPYPAYREIRAAAPVFHWEQYGYWCFARHEDVNALLRDRRFGRQITHLVSRERLGWPEIPPHLAAVLCFRSAFAARTRAARAYAAFAASSTALSWRAPSRDCGRELRHLPSH